MKSMPQVQPALSEPRATVAGALAVSMAALPDHTDYMTVAHTMSASAGTLEARFATL
jgi:hypothetical protein